MLCKQDSNAKGQTSQPHFKKVQTSDLKTFIWKYNFCHMATEQISFNELIIINTEETFTIYIIQNAYIL